MLTPPGLKGKQYRITGTAYPRLRRPGQNRRRGLKAIGILVALAVIGVGTFQLVEIFGGGKKKQSAAACAHVAADSAAGASASASAAASPGALPSPSAITVNVYNATNRTGLAGTTANQLKARGFKIGKIGNAPATLDHKVTTSGEIIGGAASKPLMTVLGTELTGAATHVDARKDASVDLVIGNGFTALLTPAQAAQALAAVASPSPKPSTSAACK